MLYLPAHGDEQQDDEVAEEGGWVTCHVQHMSRATHERAWRAGAGRRSIDAAHTTHVTRWQSLTEQV